jgi:hypothetical protein
MQEKSANKVSEFGSEMRILSNLAEDETSQVTSGKKENYYERDLKTWLASSQTSWLLPQGAGRAANPKRVQA